MLFLQQLNCSVVRVWPGHATAEKKSAMRISNYLVFISLILVSCSIDSGSEVFPDESELPVASFESDRRAIVFGESVNFTSTSTGAGELLWTFEGGEPQSSTEANPVVRYDNPGNYSVVLEAGNDSGRRSITKSSYISVNEGGVQAETAVYTVTFSGNWSVGTHQEDFPTGSDHFSSAVGMVHKEGASLFESGELASEGIENMAETGSNDALAGEIRDLIMNGIASAYFSGGGLSTGLATRNFEIVVSSEFPLVSIVSMIAPSPDWFVGLRDVVLYENGQFVEELVLEAVAYDSGTDSGSTFLSPNDDTDPAEPISRITDAPLGNGTDVAPAMAIFRFEKKGN